MATSNYATLYLVRHGETEWNRHRLMQGHGDSPLTKEGIERLKELAEELKPVHFDAVFSSDLLRAKRTAEIITLERKLVINTTNLLRERRLGKNEGKKWDDFIAENKGVFQKYESLSNPEKMTFKFSEDHESNQEIITRLLRFLREIAVTYAGKTILIVSHGGVLRVLLAHLGNPLSKGKIDNGAYIKLLTDGVDFFIKETKDITI